MKDMHHANADTSIDIRTLASSPNIYAFICEYKLLLLITILYVCEDDHI